MHLSLPWIVAICIVALGCITLLLYGGVVNSRERHAWKNVWPAWPTYEKKLEADDRGTFFEEHVLNYYRRAGFPQSTSTHQMPLRGAPDSPGDYGCDIVAMRSGRRYYAVECKNRSENAQIQNVYGIFAGRRLRGCPRARLHFTSTDATPPAQWTAGKLDVELVGPAEYKDRVDMLAPAEHGLATLFPRGVPRSIQQLLASATVAAAATALVVLSRT